MMDGVSQSLVEAVALITEKKTREQQKLQDFVRKELDKLGVNSPAELSVQKRKDLFNKVDAAFKSDAEEDGTDVEPEDKETLKKEAVHRNKKKVNEAAGDTPRQDDDERFFRVEVVNGGTGIMAIFVVAAPDKKRAAAMALDRASDEPDLQSLPNQGGQGMVVDSTVEISEDEFKNDGLSVDV